MHTLVGAGAAEGAIDAASIIKPALARGELQTIGATTLDEYRKYVEKDAALERRFQPIMVGEPSVEETIEILKGLRDRYEAHHRVSITDAALVAAATLADRYINDRFLPDKAIDLIDEAGARMRIRRMTAPPDLREFDEKIADARREKESAIDAQDFEKAARLRDQEKQLVAQRAELAAFGVLHYELADCIDIQPACLRHPCGLVQRCGDADIWIEPAGGSSHQVDGHQCGIGRISSSKRGDPSLYRCGQRRIARAEVRAG